MDRLHNVDWSMPNNYYDTVNKMMIACISILESSYNDNQYLDEAYNTNKRFIQVISGVLPKREQETLKTLLKKFEVKHFKDMFSFGELDALRTDMKKKKQIFNDLEDLFGEALVCAGRNKMLVPMSADKSHIPTSAQYDGR